jgi:ABC-2 type transport system permease protein
VTLTGPMNSTRLPADPGVRRQRRSSVSRSPRTVVVGQTARRAIRSGVIWGYIFGIAAASSAISYTTIYKTQAQRNALAAAYGSNKATSALFGPAPDLQTVAGFTVFKISMTLMILGAVWGLLTSTRLLRGEEESGRWELLLAGQITRRGAAVQALAGLGSGVVVLWALAAVITILVGLDSKVDIAAGPSLYFALAMVATAVMFLAVGVLTSQLGATRRQAASYAAVFLGLAYAVRMIADAGVGVHGLIWASPLGWVEELQPLTAPQPLALVPIVGFTAVLAIVAVYLAGRRDVGASVIADRATRPPHLRLLTGPTGLALRMVRPTVIGWWAAIAVSGLLYGLIAKSAGSTISGSSVHKVFSKLGAPGTGADAVLGVCFLVLAVLVAFVGAGQLTAARSEEAGGRLDHVLVRPVFRTSWLGGRLVVAFAVLVVSGVGAGVFAWLGAASQHAGVSFPRLLEAGVNLVPPAVAILGIGVLAFGIRPRMVSVVVYTVLGWSLLIVIVGGIGAVGHWVLDTSVFHQMASSPAVSPHWEANGVMVAIGCAGAVIGGAAFRRRDLQGE